MLVYGGISYNQTHQATMKYTHESTLDRRRSAGHGLRTYMVTPPDNRSGSMCMCTRSMSRTGAAPPPEATAGVAAAANASSSNHAPTSAAKDGGGTGTEDSQVGNWPFDAVF